MKKLLFSALMITLLAGAAPAQTTNPKKDKDTTPTTKTKTKHSASVTQKMHNVVHPNNKKYKGVKTKEKTSK